MNSAIKSKQHVNSLTGIAYALPVVPVLILMSSNNVLSGIYATYHGLSLTAISMVMLIAGLFDAFTDPSIGYFSDWYHARTGSRRPFVIGGIVLLIPSAWFLLNPGEDVTITYFLIWYLAFYLSVTLFQIPHLTWGGEISPISEEKTKIYGYRNYGGYAGMILFAFIPMLPFVEGTKVTPETMRYLVIVAAVMVLPTIYMMFRYVPTDRYRVHQNQKPENPFRAMRGLANNKPLLLFLTASAVYSIASAFYIGLKFMMMDAYLGIGDYYVYLLLFHLVMASLFVSPAMSFIEWTGKIKAWAVSMILSIFAFMTLPLVLFNNQYSLLFLVIFNLIYAFSSAINNIATYSLLSDISDYGTLKSGVGSFCHVFLTSVSSK